MKPATLISCALALLLQGCLTDAGSSSSTNEAWDTTLTVSLASITSERIVAVYPRTARYQCVHSFDSQGAELPVQFRSTGEDSTGFESDTLRYSLEGDSLWFSADTSTFDDSGRQVVIWNSLHRVSGTGLLASWETTDKARIFPVGFSAADSAFQVYAERTNLYMDIKRRGGWRTRWEISPDRLVLRMKFGAMGPFFEYDWDEYLKEGSTDVSFHLLDDNTVSYTAGDTVVTQRYLGHNRTSFSSNVPAAYPTYVDVQDPTSTSDCPEREWFPDFLSHHRKLAATARALRGSPSVGRSVPRLALPLAPFPGPR